MTIAYIGGNDGANGLAEVYQTLDDRYIMKGYMLKISTEPIKPGTSVTWSIKKGGVEVGSYYANGAWTQYETPLGAIPTTQTIYWRSDAAGSITDKYCICAKYIPQGQQNQVTAARQVESRLLTPYDLNLRNSFNEDTDMVQRAMLQIFYINKGRLTSYRIGKYDRGDQNGYYTVSATKKWSPIADEVQNFDKFARGTNANPSDILTLPILQDIWTQFKLILAAGAQGAQNTSTPAYSSTWLPNAITNSGLTMPAQFSKTPAQVLDCLVKQEGGVHSYARFDPLAVSSVQIGEKNTGSGATLHTYTDAGLGFTKVQPYNAEAPNNLYKPSDNILQGAQFLKKKRNAADPIWPADANMNVWRSVYAYNHGNFTQNKTPTELRASTIPTEVASAAYADGIFGCLTLTPPN